MTEITIPVSITSPMVTYFIANLLQCNAPIKITNFYDRNPQVTDWYYQAYISNEPGRPNSIVNIVTQHCLLGDMFIIKSGPKNGVRKWDSNLTIEQTTETLWWYQQSGHDIKTVFNERGLVHIGRRYVCHNLSDVYQPFDYKIPCSY